MNIAKLMTRNVGFSVGAMVVPIIAWLLGIDPRVSIGFGIGCIAVTLFTILSIAASGEESG
jgi:hypothetical protein